MNKKAQSKAKKNANSAKPTTDTVQEKKIDSGSKSDQSGGSKQVNKWSSIEERTKDFPKPYRNIYFRAMKSKSRQAAIRAHCLMCVGYKMREVRNCTATTCPLYPYRMGGIQK